MKLHEDQPDIQGNWWNPEDPSVKWHGILSLTAGQQGEIQLTNYGRSIYSRGAYPDTFKTLHGTSSDGKAITLRECVCRAHSRSGASEQATYSAFAVLFGAHLIDERFDSVEVEFDYLNDWMVYKRFQAREQGDDEDGAKEIRIKLNPKREFPFHTPAYAEACFLLGYCTHLSGAMFSIESRSNLQFAFRESKRLEDVLRDLREWRWFFTLATGKPIGVSRLKLYRNGDRFDFGDDSIALPVDVWLASDSPPRPKTLHDFQMTFSFPDIEKNIDGIIARWKAMQEPWAPVLQSYFSSLHRTQLRFDELFLLRARSLEAIQSIRSHGKHSIRFFEDAWERSPTGLQKHLGDMTEFANAARHYRNYLVHFRPEDEPDDPNDRLLFELTQKLQFMLTVAILEELKVAPEIIEKAFSPHRWGTLITFD